jgi:hypothetical protein
MRRGWLGGLALGLVPLGPLAAQHIGYEGGVGFATGRYIFAARTTTWTLFSGLSLAVGRFTLRAGVPLYVQNTTLLTGSGAGMMPSGGPAASGMVADSGRHGGMGGRRLPASAGALTGYRATLGDPVVQAGWDVVATSRTTLAVGAAAKIPAADTSALATGEWDEGISLALTRHVTGAWFFGLDLAYWHLGDLPQLDFLDPLLATATASVGLATGWTGSFFVTGGTEALRGYAPPLSIGVGLARHGGAVPWMASATVGLTETVPAVALGASWRIGL